MEVFIRVGGLASHGTALRKRSESDHSREDLRLAARGRIVHAESKRRYGGPRVHAAWKDEGIRCGEKRVARLMQDEELRAKLVVSSRRQPICIKTAQLCMISFGGSSSR